MSSTALSKSLLTTVASDGIVSIYYSLSVFVKTCNKVESIIWEEPPSIESFRDEVSNGFSRGKPFHFEVIYF